MGVPDNIKVRDRMVDEGIADKNTKFYLTHFTHNFAPFYESMEELAAENGFIAAHDGLQAEI
jgi:phosphoribosyl 1,2-cyclic phosphate phosphodiesterase